GSAATSPPARLAPHLGRDSLVLGPEARLSPRGDHPSVTSISLARSYFLKARKRLRALEILFDEEAYSDVVREARELVELALKGMLRFIGIEPPKQHDVGPLSSTAIASRPPSEQGP